MIFVELYVSRAFSFDPGGAWETRIELSTTRARAAREEEGAAAQVRDAGQS